METKQEIKVNFKDCMEEIIDIKHEFDGHIHTLNFQSNLFGKMISSIKQEKTGDLNIDPIIKINPSKIKTKYSKRKQRNKPSKLRGRLFKGSYIKWNSSTGIIICEICGNLYKNKVEYFCHFSTNHGLKQRKMYINKSNKIRINNIKTEAPDKEIKQELQDTLNLQHQLNVIDNFKSPLGGDVGLSDNICKGLKSKHNLNIHLHTHTSEKPFKCDICLKSFARKRGLKRHLGIHTGEKPFKCEICLKSFALKGNLNTHLRIHTSEKPFKCNICLKSFAQKYYLDTHLRIHTIEKPFKCEICSKSFALKKYLRIHLRTHTTEKPFKCEICSKSFAQKYNLNKHSRIHTGEKPFKCEICLKSFALKFYLDTHLHIHTSEKPFKCEICESFITAQQITAHTRSHADVKPYK